MALPPVIAVLGWSAHSVLTTLVRRRPLLDDVSGRTAMAVIQDLRACRWHVDGRAARLSTITTEHYVHYAFPFPRVSYVRRSITAS